jgi:hypothetical protein
MLVVIGPASDPSGRMTVVDTTSAMDGGRAGIDICLFKDSFLAETLSVFFISFFAAVFGPPGSAFLPDGFFSASVFFGLPRFFGESVSAAIFILFDSVLVSYLQLQLRAIQLLVIFDCLFSGDEVLSTRGQRVDARPPQSKTMPLVP